MAKKDQENDLRHQKFMMHDFHTWNASQGMEFQFDSSESFNMSEFELARVDDS